MRHSIDHTGSSSSASSVSSSYAHPGKERQFHDDDNDDESVGGEFSDDYDDDDDDEDTNENDQTEAKNNSSFVNSPRKPRAKPKTKVNSGTKGADSLEETFPSSSAAPQEASLLTRYQFNAQPFQSETQSLEQTSQSPLLASFINNQSGAYSNSFASQYSMFSSNQPNFAESNLSQQQPANTSTYAITNTTSLAPSMASHYGGYQFSASSQPNQFSHHHPHPHHQNYTFINSAPHCQASDYATYQQSLQSSAQHCHAQFMSVSGGYANNSAATFLPTMKQIITSSPMSSNCIEHNPSSLLHSSTQF